ncbi:SR-related and CTD-associated factor 4 like protein [Argiope bruennichi]|uniref:SR-related and CTD-associated factor 4 like protein n=1 Tax=Argiope bruennichi TaxID=94029 RepID=A0A8T0EKF1_ARGBR|nr:SR-related and CTD-associated factor 4 like protein [Argiope bruennichi]
MDAVKAFNSELSSLYDVKPPISKAKMTSITKSAIKGIKFYKHIVQSVEKFIQKCRPEYKVPGLYVVDSIVRQSRHQFGADKDVFGPRFVKNITTTFQNLFKCAEEDRPKIIRVLNLWQKNNVFPIDVIQPLLDMGHPNTSNETTSANEESRISRHKVEESNSWKGWPQGNDEPPPDNRTYAEMSTKNLEKFTKSEMVNAMEDESRSSLFRAQLKQENLQDDTTVKFNKKLLDFDYGDEEDEEESKNDENNLSNQPNALALSMAQNLLCNPELLRKLQQMQQTIQQNALNSELSLQGQQPVKDEPEEAPYSSDLPSSPTQQSQLPTSTYRQQALQPMELKQKEADKDDRVLPQPPLPPKDLDERSLAAIMTPRLIPPTSLASYQQPGMAQTDKDDRIIPDLAVPPRDLDERSLAAILAPLDRGMLPPMSYNEASNMMQYPAGMPYQPQQPPMPMMESVTMDTGYGSVLSSEQQQHMMQRTDEDERLMYSMPGEPPLPPQDFDERTAMVTMEERSRKERSRSRSGSRSRRSGRHRSRSKSPRKKRSRSRSPRSKNRSRSKERERIREKERERERERERKRKGIPPIKKGYVSVCSTTLWIGHVPKSCTEMEISSAFGQYGTILSIDMIPPRGCAYVVMDRRQDAYRALQKLRNTKFLQSSSVKMAWAPGKGVKGKEYKDYWEVEAGVSYVPIEKIAADQEALDLLEEGGFIDEESLPEHLKALRQGDDKSSYGMQKSTPPETTTYNAIQAPPMVPPPIIPSTSVNLPMLLPHPMQPQFGLHLPGLLPPQAMVMQVPMGIPPPNPMLMVQQQSQNMLGNQTLPIVGGVPPIVPRTLPAIPSTLPNMTNTTVDSANASSGDATPTEEDGTNVSSPNVIQNSVPSSVSSTSTISTQAGIPATQYNPMMNLPNSNRLSVPPPVSTTGTPIPYPPPQNVGFNFPPPGMRPPGMAHNSQFPWMQKPPGSPFTESDSNQSRNVPGVPPHMFNNRPPFHEVPSSLPQNSPMKDGHSNRDMERRPGDMDPGNRSPMHSDKMSQEMVISTDDESSMDRDYSHGEMKGGPRFQGVTEFPRMPVNMHRMRNPMVPMQGGRFPPGMPPFPPRIPGPRGPGMHPGHRMEMDFPGPRGPRMPGLIHGPRRMDGPHHPNDGRDWYPRDFDGPPFERDRHFFNDRNRDSWTTPEQIERDSRHMPRNHERHDERMRDMENRDGPNSYGPPDQVEDIFEPRGRPRPGRKSKPDDMMEDMFKVQFYQRDKNPAYQSHLNKQLDRRRKDDMTNRSSYKNDDVNKSTDLSNIDVNNRTVGDKMARSDNSVDQDSSGPRKDRESRKRSRWGRTLSEEREFQQQKRNEIEMKFQSYEQSAQAAQLLQPNSQESSENTVEIADCSTTDPTNTQQNADDVSVSVSSSQSLNSEKHESEDSASELQTNDSALNSDLRNPSLESDTVHSINTPEDTAESFAPNSVFDATDSQPSSDSFVTNSSKPFLANTDSESSGTNHVSESFNGSMVTDCKSASLDTDSSISNSVSEQTDLYRLPVSLTKETDRSSIAELVSNPSFANSEENFALKNEPTNHIGLNSEASLNDTIISEDISENSSTNKSPLLSTDS